jgi:hypothetical protein
MGRLIALKDLDLTPHWYFSDTWFSVDGRRHVYSWPSPDFPHQVAIHTDSLDNYNGTKIKIRQWIERNLSETVILSEVEKNYRVYYDEERTWEHSHERRNNWYVFHFEDEHSATMFRLAFSDLVKEITDLHPDNKDEYEKTSYYKAYR